MARRDPAFLTEVMDTIASFRDSKGSAPDKILDRIISQRKTPLKNASLQVKKALKTGIKSGLLKEIGGKFKLGLGSKDYAIFKNFRMMEKGGLPIKELRRRGKGRRRSKRKKRGKRRRRSEFFDVDNLDLSPDISKRLSLIKLAKSKTLPIMELRRRGRRGKSRRRRKKRGRRRSGISTMDALDLEHDISTEPVDRGRRKKKRKGKKRGRRGRRRAAVLEDEDVESTRSSDSKEISRKSSEERPKTSKSVHGESRNPLEKRDIVPEPPRNRMDENGSGHCIHNFHHDGGHYGHPPHQGHYGGEYYD